jgi:hypothetical protein
MRSPFHICSVVCPFTQNLWRNLLDTFKISTSWGGSSLSDCLENWFKVEFFLIPYQLLFVGICGWKGTDVSLIVVLPNPEGQYPS